MITEHNEEQPKECRLADAIHADSIFLVEPGEEAGTGDSSLQNDCAKSMACVPSSETIDANPIHPKTLIPLESAHSDLPPSMSCSYIANSSTDHSRIFRRLCDPKQLFNGLYFALAGCCLVILANVWNLPALALLSCVFMPFVIAAMYFSINKKAQFSDFAITLPTRLRKTIRFSALMVPVPLFVAAGLLLPANYELSRGIELSNLGNYPEAIEHLTKATQFNPRSERAFSELANVYMHTMNQGGALSAIEAALSVNPNNGDTLATKATLLNGQDQYAAAVQTALAATTIDPQNGPAFHALAYAHYHLGQYEPALAAATKHLQLHKDEKGAFLLRANILDQLGRTEEAASDRTRDAAIPEFPGNE